MPSPQGGRKAALLCARQVEGRPQAPSRGGRPAEPAGGPRAPTLVQWAWPRAPTHLHAGGRAVRRGLRGEPECRCHSPALLPDFRVGLTPPSFPPSLPPPPPPPPPQVPGPRPARWGGASDPRGAGRVSPTQLEAAPSPAEGCYPGSWDRLASLGGVALSTLPVAGGRGHIFPRPPPGHPAGETPKPTVIPLEEKQGLAGVRLGRL